MERGGERRGLNKKALSNLKRAGGMAKTEGLDRMAADYFTQER